jgi:di/tricarboxylate transporter
LTVLEILDIQMWATLALMLLTVIGFATERLPIEVVAASLIAFLLIFFHFLPVSDSNGQNELNAAKILSGFANPGLITIVSLLIVGGAMVRTGALEGLAAVLYRLSGGKVLRGLLISLIPVAVVSSVLNNTPVVIIFIPIVGAFAERIGVSVSRLLIPLSFASILGGMTTLIGSSTNLLVSGVASDLNLPPIQFFDFFIPGAVLAITGLLYVIFVAPKLIPDRAPMASQLATEDREFIAQIEVLPGSPLIGQNLSDGTPEVLAEMTVRMIQRSEHSFLPPLEWVELMEGDVVVVAATRKVLIESINKLPRALHPSPTHQQLLQRGSNKELGTLLHEDLEAWQDGDQVLAEAMVAPAASIAGRNLESIGFRHTHTCIVLGIQRRSQMIRQRLTEIKLEEGDVLLIQGPPEKVHDLRNSRDVVLMELSQHLLPRYFHAQRAAFIFVSVVLAAATGAIPIVVAALTGAAAMLVTGCIDIRDAVRAVDSRIVLTIAASLGLGTALQVTGGSEFVALFLIVSLDGLGPGAVISVLFIIIAIVTNVLSNNASAVLFTPIAINVATALGVDPMPFIYAVIFGASCSFASPIGYQTNLIIMAPGHYRFVDFVKAGTPLILILWLAFSAFFPWYYNLPFTTS